MCVNYLLSVRDDLRHHTKKISPSVLFIKKDPLEYDPFKSSEYRVSLYNVHLCCIRCCIQLFLDIGVMEIGKVFI